MMERQLGQLVRLVDDLLDISRISRNKLELRKARIALASVVENAVETARPLIDAKGHTLTVTLPPAAGLPRRRPDAAGAGVLEPAQQQRQVHRSGRAHRAHAPTANGHEVVVSVRDTGIGIPAEASARHVRDVLAGGPQPGALAGRAGHRPGAGQGPGRDARRTASRPQRGVGQGSEFVVRLPLASRRGRRRAAADRRRALRTALPRRRILVVDDNRDAAASLGMMLSLMGHDTRTAHDGLEALELAEAFRPDVVLLDIGLPKLNGYDACRRIREQPWGQGMCHRRRDRLGSGRGPPAIRKRRGSITTWSSRWT